MCPLLRQLHFLELGGFMKYETPEKAVYRLAVKQIKERFILQALHEYCDSENKPIYWRIRLKHLEKGEKWIRPMHRNEQGIFVLGNPNFISGKPLYRLPEIIQNPNEIIWITEGEWCTDHLVSLGLIATTSGSAESSNKTDWTPLADRQVIIWRDNDDAGLRYAHNVTQQLQSLNCNVQWVDVTQLNLPPKGDCVDWLAVHEKATFNDLMQLVGVHEVKKQLTGNLEKKQISLKDIDINDEMLMIRELGSFSLIEYDRNREPYAEKLSIRVSTLDELVKAERHKNNNTDKSIIFSDIEPWPESVDGNALLSLLTEKLQQFVILNEHEARTIALWVLLTYCIDAVDVSPILNISSPEKRCGKSTVMSLLQLLVNRPLLAANISTAAIFRTIESLNPTLLLDEADTFINDEKSELRGIINSGHTRSTAFVIRTVGDTHEPYIFSTWCAKCLAGIGNLPDTIKDRSIIIQLRRKLPHETVASLRHTDKSIFNHLQRQCARFAADNLSAIRTTRPSVPTGLNDRAADSWEPLIAIADVARGDWPNYARQAALALSSLDDAVSVSIELLQDIKNIFEQKKMNRISTAELLEALYFDYEAPWATYNRGKPITARQLSKRLKDFGIMSKNYRFGLNLN